MTSPPLEVAVAIIRDAQRKILVNQRQPDKDHAGFWEFPGGKFVHGETASQALARECMEELGITVLQDEPLMQVTHAYSNKTVHLHVYLVLEYSNTPTALEDQPLVWKSLDELQNLDLLLPADQVILDKLAEQKD